MREDWAALGGHCSEALEDVVPKRWDHIGSGLRTNVQAIQMEPLEARRTEPDLFQVWVEQPVTSALNGANSLISLRSRKIGQVSVLWKVE